MDRTSILVSQLKDEEMCCMLTLIGPSIMAEGWTLYTFSAIVVGLRVFTQLRITRQFGTGDIVMIAALVSSSQSFPERG